MRMKCPQLTKDVLYNMYWVEGKSLPMIGKEIGCSHPTVGKRMRKFGIKIRTISEANAGERHPNYGKHPSEETRKKMSHAKMGVRPTKETRKKLSTARTGKHPSEETRKKLSGEKNHNYGRHRSEETCNKISVGNIGKRTGIRPTKETCQRISDSHEGEKNGSWKGGISYVPYCPRFNFQLKERIREKHGRVCFLCGKTEKENRGRLSIHHVDGDKNQGCNGKEWILVPLCKSCHGKIHHNKKLNNKLLAKLCADGYIISPHRFHIASLNDYITAKIIPISI
ncbi:MAG: NUMOD3 motif (2 copies) [Candidatus Methanolliviera sp. GoM_oil]|nr:MAG: NUMOD3 motif (2 copies) [Candidatus Methanolliviera sp. GoM_oil]